MAARRNSVVPSWKYGFARSAGESDAPHQWDGLIGAWAPLLGPQGAALYDVSGYGRHGVLTSMDPAGDWLVDDRGYYLDFDGTNDYVTFGDVCDPLDLDYSISCWLKPAALSGVLRGFIGKEAVGQADRFYLGISSTDLLQGFWRVDATSAFEANFGGTTFSLNVWHHVAVTFDRDGVATGYINGTALPTTHSIASLNGLTFDNAQPLILGNRYTASAQRYTGGMDDIRVYARVLSPVEVWDISTDPHALYRLRRRRAARGPVGITMQADSGTYSLTGTAVALKANRIVPASSGTYTLSGTAAGTYYNRKVAADSGVYSVTGSDVTFPRTFVVMADSGTYLVTGSAANLLWKHLLSADAGNYSITGTNAGLLIARVLTAGSGVYTLTGSDATLTYSGAGGFTLVAESGTYALTGSIAGLLAGRVVPAESGSYVITGSQAGLLFNRVVQADAGAYTITGVAAALLKGYRVEAVSGVYQLTGQDVTFPRTFVLDAESGLYTLAGTPALLIYSGEETVGVYIPTFRRRRR